MKEERKSNKEEPKELEAIKEYADEIRKYQKLWKSLEVQTVSAKQNGTWKVLGMHLIFSNRICSKSIHDVLLQTPSVVITKEIRDIEKIHDIFNSLKNKSIKVGNLNVKMEGFSSFDWGRSSRGGNPLDYRGDWPIIWLRTSGKSVSQIVKEEEINKELNRLGYGSIYEESAETLDFPVGGSTMTRIYFIAPLFIRIKSGSLERNKLTITISSHKSVSNEEIRAVSPTVSKGKNIPLKKTLEKDDFVEYQGEVKDISTDIDSVIVRAYYRNEPEQIDLERICRSPIEISSKNPRFAALSSLMSENFMRKWLGIEKRITPPAKGKETKLDMYEAMSLNILSCAGFSIFDCGRGLKIEGIDGLAFSPDSREIVALSFTRGTAIHEKMEKIKPICNKLRETLNSYEVIPVICSPSPRKDFLDEDKSACKNEGIALITSDEMKEIYDLAVKGLSEEILRIVKRQITDVTFR